MKLKRSVLVNRFVNRKSWFKFLTRKLNIVFKFIYSIKMLLNFDFSKISGMYPLLRSLLVLIFGVRNPVNNEGVLLICKMFGYSLMWLMLICPWVITIHGFTHFFIERSNKRVILWEIILLSTKRNIWIDWKCILSCYKNRNPSISSAPTLEAKLLNKYLIGRSC